jgi:hypothetical protein
VDCCGSANCLTGWTERFDIQGASRKFGEWYQKTNAKEDTNKLTILAFKMIHIRHNKLLETKKLRCSSGGFANFWGPPNPGTTIFMGTHLNFTEGICPFEESPKLKFDYGAIAHFGGPLGPFGVSGPKIKLYYGAIVLLGRLPNSNFTPGILPIWGLLGYFENETPAHCAIRVH